MRDVLDSCPAVFVKYHKGLAAATALLAKRRDPNVSPTIHIWWGDSGTGKSRKAVTDYPDGFILTKPNGNNCVWFDGYEGQQVIIFDEFYGWIQYDLLLRILDRYPLKLQIKGGFVECSATTFIFTSNKPWQEWYNLPDVSALERRIKEFGHVTHFAKL